MESTCYAKKVDINKFLSKRILSYLCFSYTIYFINGIKSIRLLCYKQTILQLKGTKSKSLVESISRMLAIHDEMLRDITIKKCVLPSIIYLQNLNDERASSIKFSVNLFFLYIMFLGCCLLCLSCLFLGSRSF